MDPVTESKVVIDPQGVAKVMHRVPVRSGHATLCIVSLPEHDRHAAALERKILDMAASRGGDFVRLSDVADAMKGLNRELAEAPCGPHGVMAALVHQGAQPPRPARRAEPHSQQLDVTLCNRASCLFHRAYRPELSRYAARAAAYLWNDLQALTPVQQKVLARELGKREWERSASDELARQALARVQAEEGWTANRGITTCVLPPAKRTRASRQPSGRARR